MCSHLLMCIKVKISLNIEWWHKMYHFIYDSFLPCVPHPWPVLRWRRTGRWEFGSRWPPASPWGCSLWAAPWAESAGGDPAPTLRIGEGGFIGWGKESQNKKQVEKDLLCCVRLKELDHPGRKHLVLIKGVLIKWYLGSKENSII